MAEQVSFSAPLSPAVTRSDSASDFMVSIEKVLEDYSNQLIALLASERELEIQQNVLLEDEEVLTQLPFLIKLQLDNRERVEMLFLELSRKMWDGRLPAVSIAIIEKQYRESTGRLLKEDLKEAQWPAYFSAFQLSIDILNGRGQS